MSAGVELNGLSKIYSLNNGRKLNALNDVNIKVESGGFCGLLGPNGAGKSTIINIISGVTNRTSGSVKVANFDIDNDWVQFRRSVGVVPQELVFDPYFTVRDSIDYYAGFYGVPKRERKVDEIIDRLGLGDKRHVKPRMLSGGMKRRLLIAKAVIHSPAVVILDEPTAGLDIESRRILWDFIRELNANGTTIILTTHYMEEVQQLCESIVIINRGNVILQDKKEVIIDRLGEKKMILRLSSNIDVVPESILAVFPDAVIDNSAVIVKVRENSGDFTAIMRLLGDNNLNVVDVKIRESTIEDIMMKILAGN